MPDGLTHVLAGYICFGKRVRNGWLMLFFLGSLLPDILLRGGRLLFFNHPDKDYLELFLVPLHTPVSSAFLCLALSICFHSTIRTKVFFTVYSGCMAHFFLDFFQKNILGTGLTILPYGGYHWFYPFTWFDVQLGLVWAENTLYALAILIPIAIVLYLKR